MKLSEVAISSERNQETFGGVGKEICEGGREISPRNQQATALPLVDHHLSEAKISSISLRLKQLSQKQSRLSS
jgi:hypothetical protein